MSEVKDDYYEPQEIQERFQRITSDLNDSNPILTYQDYFLKIATPQIRETDIIRPFYRLDLENELKSKGSINPAIIEAARIQHDTAVYVLLIAELLTGKKSFLDNLKKFFEFLEKKFPQGELNEKEKEFLDTYLNHAIENGHFDPQIPGKEVYQKWDLRKLIKEIYFKKDSLQVRMPMIAAFHDKIRG